MHTIEILSLPQIKFAHTYQAESYHSILPEQDNCIEVSYIAEGCMPFRQGGQSYLAEKGDITCNLYKIDQHIMVDAFHCHHTVCASLSFQICDRALDQLYLPPVTKSSADTALIRQMIDRLIYDPDSYVGPVAKGAGWFLRILSEIDRCNKNNANLHLPGDQLYAARAKDYIHRHLHTAITQRQVAEHLGISPGYLCSIFKEVEQITLMQYVNTKKLENIKLLMEQKNLKLNQAASLYGYHDANYVSRLYKKMFQHNITDKPTTASLPPDTSN